MKTYCQSLLNVQKVFIASLMGCFLGCSILYASDINWDEVDQSESQGIGSDVRREIKLQIYKSFNTHSAAHTSILEALTDESPYPDENAEFMSSYKGLASTLFERAMQFLTACKRPGGTLQDIKTSLGNHLRLSNYSLETYDPLSDEVELKDMIATRFPTFLMPVSDFIHSFFIHPATHYYNAAMPYATGFDQKIIMTDMEWMEKAFALYFPKWIPLEARKFKKKSILSGLKKKH